MGLYGVDLKLINGRAVVIEINDNPSIDHEVEDAVLGDELYYRILNHFVHCLNRLHAPMNPAVGIRPATAGDLDARGSASSGVHSRKGRPSRGGSCATC